MGLEEVGSEEEGKRSTPIRRDPQKRSQEEDLENQMRVKEGAASMPMETG